MECRPFEEDPPQFSWDLRSSDLTPEQLDFLNTSEIDIDEFVDPSDLPGYY